MTEVGVEALSFSTSRYYLDLKELARARGVDPDKYIHGIGQEQMAIAPPDEDVVTLAATSAQQALEGIDTSDIAMLIVATESGIDQSKALGIWVHHLLNLPKGCRVVECKQACYAGCASLQMALSFLHQYPDKKVLLIATDIARYGLKTPGEPTQGCGACALLLSCDPKIVAFDREYGAYTSHVMDFWRPNYSEEAFVDGKYSTRTYLSALEECWNSYQQMSKRTFDEHDHFCYHIPFIRMATKAHDRLSKLNGKEPAMHKIQDSLYYSRKVGNSYTASLFIGLASLLEQSKEDLSHKRLGFFSYGSGCVAEFFSGRILKGYQNHLKEALHTTMLEERIALTVPEYEAFFSFRVPQDGSHFLIDAHKTGPFRFVGVNKHERLYSTAQK